MSKRRHRSSSPFSLGGIGDILNNVDISTLFSLLSQFAPMNASQSSSPLGNLGNIANLMSQFSSKQDFYNQNQGINQRRSRHNNNRSNSIGDFDIDAFNNILSQIGFGSGVNSKNNQEYSNSSRDDETENFINITSREDYEEGEDVIELLRILKKFLTEDRGKVIDAMITLYEENSK